MAHKCPVRRCSTVVADDRKLMCPPDWALVPVPLQRALNRVYHDGAPVHILREAQLACVRAVNNLTAAPTATPAEGAPGQGHTRSPATAPAPRGG
jgi:hypothetical protein